MSSFKVKTTYNTEGIYGSTEEKTLYAVHNNSSDYVTFYDEDGEILLVVPDTVSNNILEAIIRLYQPYENGSVLKPDVEYLTEEDVEKIF